MLTTQEAARVFSAIGKCGVTAEEFAKRMSATRKAGKTLLKLSGKKIVIDTKPKETDSKAAIGAKVVYCGHNGYFVADIFHIAGACVVRANGSVTPGNLIRQNVDEEATHIISDFPHPGFWRPDLGVFVVPEDQLEIL